MKAYKDKKETSPSHSRAISAGIRQIKNGHCTIPTGPEVAQMKKLQELAEHSSEVRQLKAARKLADDYSESMELAQLTKIANLHPTKHRASTVGNSQSAATVQLFKDKKSGQTSPIIWNNIREIDLMNIYNMVISGNYEFEDKEELEFYKKMDELGMSFDKKDDDKFSEFDGNQLDPNQQELFDYMNETLSNKVNQRDGKKLPGRTVQGDMLEWTTSTFTNDIDINEVNANEYAMNMAGIDHLQDNHKFSFIQDKLHLSPHTANTDTYRKHYENRHKMSAKLLAEIDKNGLKAQKIMSMFQDAISNNAWLHKDYLQKLVNIVDNHREEYKKALNSFTTNTLPSLVDDDNLIRELGDRIAFTVPSDIWEALYQLYEKGVVPKEEMYSYIRLDMSTSDFIKVFDLLSDYANPYNEQRTKDEDEDWSE
ncbi:hypothetical protein C900_02099 [Fulvivirga imtechensis AK7]|uniref:Uncharacterized protein n=1 Tax=Fulvivirga imtechensis AK7 TaxID=1237149 RepID=L8JY46_9BACT|nr:hypothetical protein [Fulvivirga imtechensis]ELR73695.1 hypothetical protein C900_02099 [Fulvivirga imtechensis AK7]